MPFHDGLENGEHGVVIVRVDGHGVEVPHESTAESVPSTSWFISIGLVLLSYRVLWSKLMTVTSFRNLGNLQK